MLILSNWKVRVYYIMILEKNVVSVSAFGLNIWKVNYVIVVNEALQVLLPITSAYLWKSGCSVTYKHKNKLHKWMEPEHVLRRGLSAIKKSYLQSFRNFTMSGFIFICYPLYVF